MPETYILTYGGDVELSVTMLPYYFKSAFDLIEASTQLPKVVNGNTVYVISDTEYKKYQQAEALKEIEVLENRALSYEKTAASIRETIVELQTEAGLLPPSEQSAGDDTKVGLTE